MKMKEFPRISCSICGLKLLVFLGEQNKNKNKIPQILRLENCVFRIIDQNKKQEILFSMPLCLKEFLLPSIHNISLMRNVVFINAFHL